VLVYLVGKRESVKFFTKVGNEFKFVSCEYLSGRIVRIAYDDRFRPFVESRAQFIAIKGKAFVGSVKRNESRRRAEIMVSGM
jgi:hypothetical protein